MSQKSPLEVERSGAEARPTPPHHRQSDHDDRIVSEAETNLIRLALSAGLSLVVAFAFHTYGATYDVALLSAAIGAVLMIVHSGERDFTA